MKKTYKLFSLLMAVIFAMALLAACGKDSSGAAGSSGSGNASDGDGVKVFSAFIAVPGTEVSSDNRLLQKIAEKTGAYADVVWLTGQTASERIGVMVAGGEYPDFLEGGDGYSALIEAKAFIPIDEYWDDYPNIKNYMSEYEWNSLRHEDGHIYTIPPFGNVNIEDRNPWPMEAFWIQKRVLEWDGFPEIVTLYEYFDLIERYLEVNPTNEDGTNNIGFEILSDDWRYFCLENPPAFLAGYPNDGQCIVNPETLEAKVYDTIPEAEEYFGVLNEMYHKGVIDPETFTMNYDQYIAKLTSGRVLGMIDQYWQFMNAHSSLIDQEMFDRTYVPLGLVLDENVESQYRSPAEDMANTTGGMGITVSCDDIPGAMKFLNDLLSEEILIMRSWGEEGVDYFVDEDGVFYRNEEQRANSLSVDWVNKNMASGVYSYFPHYEGVLKDGINSANPAEQPDEFYAVLSDYDKKVLDAYGHKTWNDFLNVGELYDWYPMWSYNGTWSGDLPYLIAWQKMGDVKKEWLPKVIMSDDFEGSWSKYMTVYHDQVDVEAYETEMTAEVLRRVEKAKAKYE